MMCGGGYPFVPYGMAPPQAWGLHPSNIYQQMLGMQNQSQQDRYAQMLGMSSTYHGTPDVEPIKKCVCAYCGRPAKPAQENSCPGCGAWEVEFV